MLLESLSRNDLKFNDMLEGSVNVKMACPVYNGLCLIKNNLYIHNFEN